MHRRASAAFTHHHVDAYHIAAYVLWHLLAMHIGLLACAFRCTQLQKLRPSVACLHGIAVVMFSPGLCYPVANLHNFTDIISHT